MLRDSNNMLRNTLKLLPAAPEEIAQAHIRQEVIRQQMDRLLEELASLNMWQRKRRLHLIQQLQELHRQK